MLKQVCIIPFRRDYLIEFNNLPETPLERVESVDMMRVVEHGEDVYMVMTDIETLSVDTPAELERVADLMRNDGLRNLYQGEGNVQS
jgi:3-deoxy-manno-octulosonate cytidylyltransferase (CMP-KDO synthetase)